MVSRTTERGARVTVRFTQFTETHAEDEMATRSASLPIEQTYLAKARLAVMAIVLVAAVGVTTAGALGRSPAAGGTGLGPVRDYGPVTVQNDPLVVNGS